MQSLERRLGVVGSMAIGIAAMLGAGVFFVWKPAFDLAGEWLLLSLGIAALVATLNGLVTTQLAINHPVSGGIYSFGRHYRGPLVGFMAGWFFLTGKTGSAAAIALIAATYLVPDYAGVVAAALIAVFTGIVIAGIRATATVSLLIAAVVLSGLVALSTPAIAERGIDLTMSTTPGLGVLTAAGLMFFAFAGYARMATLGEEVKDPRRTLPRAIVGALVVVLALYALVALAVIPRFADSGAPEAPLTVLTTGLAPGLLTALAVLACGGSLLAILAGLSRTGLQMARHRDIPGALARISPRTGGPLVAEVSVGLVAIVLVLLTDPLWLVGLSSTGVLAYYAIGHYSALAQPATERFLPAVVPVIGLVLCVVLVATLPPLSLLAGLVWAAAGIVWFVIARRGRTSEVSS
jgi:APA family basic amino acid/polyamine antiporter